MNQNDNSLNPETNEIEQGQKIQSLRDMIMSAEKTIQGAKAMLLQIEGKKKTGRKRKVDDSEGMIVQGVFDGQLMIGTDGKQYPVPANYASKSKLVEGDTLKLTITPDGSFLYKQVGPADRRHVIGIVSQDEAGNYLILAEGKPYKVLLASVTYFKLEPGDEVAILLPNGMEAVWASIENVLQKGHDNKLSYEKFKDTLDELKSNDEQPKTLRAYGVDDDFSDSVADNESHTQPKSQSIIDEWTPDIEAIEQEIKNSHNS